jgi:hypothetical protein
LQSGIREIASDLDSFQKALSKKHEESRNKLKNFAFSNTDFDAIAVGRKEIEELYKNATKLESLIDNKENSFSKYFDSFKTTSKLILIENRLKQLSDAVYLNKVKEVKLLDLLYNRSRDFPMEVNLNAKLSNMNRNSQPLLRTKKISPEMPLKIYTVIGQTSNDLNSEFNSILNDLNFNALEIDADNGHTLGLATIKNNFSFSMINGISEWDVKSSSSKLDQSEYYINSDSKLFSLIPSKNGTYLNSPLKLRDDLIICLTEGVIYFNNSKDVFECQLLGELGSTLEQLKKVWSTKRVFDLKNKAISLTKKVDDMTDDEMIEFRHRILDLASSIKLNKSDKIILDNFYLGMGGDEELLINLVN